MSDVYIILMLTFTPVIPYKLRNTKEQQGGVLHEKFQYTPPKCCQKTIHN